MFTNRRPYCGLKMSTTNFFREPVRYLKESNTQESMMEKPYLEDEYPKMHLKLPDFKFKPREIPSIFGPIADGDPFPGLAMIDFGDAKCSWRITNVDYCTEGPVIITIKADYLWHAEFEFVAGIASDSIGVSLAQLGPTEASGWDEQDYLLTFPENANGSVTVCGFASTHTLVSQTFETVVAGMPVGIHLIGGALLPIERGQSKPATLLKSVYGDKGDDCGCITIGSDCTPPCNCEVSILYTSRFMEVDELQTLTVDGYVEGCEYFWTIVTGGGGLSSPPFGESVTYHSPTSNTNCDENPTIELRVGGNVCDTLSLSIGETGVGGEAYRVYPGNSHCSSGYCYQYVEFYDCYDVYTRTLELSCDPSGWIQCPDPGCAGCYSGTYDLRTPTQLEAGCCPAGLL